MLIQQKEINRQGIFFVNDDSRQVAELIYTMISPDKMVIEHTEVDNSLRGKHVGNDLVTAAVHFARTNERKIIPRCPFAKLMFEKYPEWHDVLLAAPMEQKVAADIH
ncbi:MAG: N-acetyltransferase [Williamsia sp.]|nr:N-acetyltransferase [Williamsia sp.]